MDNLGIWGFCEPPTYRYSYIFITKLQITTTMSLRNIKWSQKRNLNNFGSMFFKTRMILSIFSFCGFIMNNTFSNYVYLGIYSVVYTPRYYTDQ